MPSVFLKIFLKELVVYGYGTNSYYSFLGLGTTYIIFYPPLVPILGSVRHTGSRQLSKANVHMLL